MINKILKIIGYSVLGLILIFCLSFLTFILFFDQGNESYIINEPKEYHPNYYSVSENSVSKAPTTIKSLPIEIQDSIELHFNNWVGSEFYSTLQYDGGQIINTEVEPDLPKYNLHFSFSNKEVGILKYTASICLRSNGSLYDYISLPNIRREPHKRKIINLKEAFSIAQSKTIDKGELKHADISFDPNTYSIKWTFDFETDKGNIEGYRHIIDINAHTGEVLDQHKMIIYKKGMIDEPEDFLDILEDSRYENE